MDTKRDAHLKKLWQLRAMRRELFKRDEEAINWVQTQLFSKDFETQWNAACILPDDKKSQGLFLSVLRDDKEQLLYREEALRRLDFSFPQTEEMLLAFLQRESSGILCSQIISSLVVDTSRGGFSEQAVVVCTKMLKEDNRKQVVRALLERFEHFVTREGVAAVVGCIYQENEEISDVAEEALARACLEVERFRWLSQLLIRKKYHCEEYVTTRAALAAAFGGIQDADIILNLQYLLVEDPSPWVREQAALSLSLGGLPEVQRYPVLQTLHRALIEEKYAQVRSAMVIAIAGAVDACMQGELTSTARLTESFGYLWEQLLREPDPEVREEICILLEKYPAPE